jgi:uncharacterized phage-associated protein
MRFIFNEEKAAEAAAYLLELAGGTMPYIRLIKLLYLADRQSLIETGHPIVGDQVVSMDHGPVLSRVYDLIKGVRHDGPWQHFVSRRGYDVRLEQPAPTDGVLSDYERHLLTAVYTRYRDVGTWALIDLLHVELPEWVDPEGSSVPIEPETILRAGGRSVEDIAEMAEEADQSFVEHRFFFERVR